MTFPLLLALAVALMLFYWVWVAAPRGSQARREALLLAQGQASGAKFFPPDQRFMLGEWEQTCILFDAQARKACIVARGKSARTVDFEYFRNWQLKWTEDLNSPLWRYKHVHIHFETQDFERPTLRVNVSFKADGDTWNAKLELLLT